MKTFPILAFALLNSPFVLAGDAVKSLQLSLGMEYQEALSQLKNAGAHPFRCSYKYGTPAGGPRPYFVYGWFTLPNGMSISIHGDKEVKNRERQVTDLSICNSTMLFCCKGETWYTVKSVSSTNGMTVVGSPSIWIEAENKSREIAPFLIKGMVFSECEKILKTAGLKHLPVDDAWLVEMPKEGKWERYSMKCGDGEYELILNFHNESHLATTKLKLMIVEATKPKKDGNEAVRYRIECEFLDLKEPLEKNWYWAFEQPWAWKPGDPKNSTFLKVTNGQGR